MSAGLDTIEATRNGLAGAGYLADERTALVAFLAGQLGKPVLVEGLAGVGRPSWPRRCRGPPGAS